MVKELNLYEVRTPGANGILVAAPDQGDALDVFKQLHEDYELSKCSVVYKDTVVTSG